MSAPSEKHLEDWIVENFSQFGEKFELTDYPPGYVDEDDILDNDMVVTPFFERILKRQFRLPTGIADLITFSERQLSVVELKKCPVTYDTIGQCLRYMYDLNEIYQLTSEDGSMFPVCGFRPPGSWEVFEIPDGHIAGMVVGHGMIDANIPLVAATANIRVVTYQFDGQRYDFEHQFIQRRAPIATYRDYAMGAIGDAFLQIRQNDEHFHAWCERS